MRLTSKCRRIVFGHYNDPVSLDRHKVHHGGQLLNAGHNNQQDKKASP